MILAAVLAIAPVAGIPPNNAEPILPIPCATSSIFERCFEFIILSATTHERSDSIAARTAIVNPSENRSLTIYIDIFGICNAGKELLIVYKSPIVFTFIPSPFTIAIPAKTAISEPGITLLIYGHMIKIARHTTPTTSACQLSVPMCFITASIFSIVSIGFTPLA